MSSQCSNSCRRVNCGIIFDLMRAFPGCGGCVGGNLASGEKSDQVFILFKIMEISLHVRVLMD